MITLWPVFEGNHTHTQKGKPLSKTFNLEHVTGMSAVQAGVGVVWGWSGEEGGRNYPEGKGRSSPSYLKYDSTRCLYWTMA